MAAAIETANLLGISRKNLWEKVKKYAISAGSDSGGGGNDTK